MESILRLPSMILVLLLVVVPVSGQETKQPSAPADSCDGIVAGVEHADALADACRFALSLRHKLPNVICDQKTFRYKREPNEDQKLQDFVTAHVIYEGGVERYSDVTVDGTPASEEDAQAFGLHTKGEFGSDQVFAFWPYNHPAYSFLRKDHIDGHKVYVFRAKVERENNHSWRMDADAQHTFPEFNAIIWLDQTTHEIVRLDVLPVPEKGFPIVDPYVRTEYKRLPLGDGTSFVLPVKSESGSCVRSDKGYLVFCYLNVLSFNNCHKFSTKSRIVTDLNSMVK